MVINMFHCYSLKSSHSRLLPQSPKVCSLHLCLFCCLAYRVIVTIFLNSFILIWGQLRYNIVVVFALHWHESAMGVHVFPHPEPLSHLPPYPIPLGCSSALVLSALFHTSNLDWSSISHMVIYMLQCYSLRSSHRRLLQSLKVCSLYLCLFCCLAYRVIIPSF